MSGVLKRKYLAKAYSLFIKIFVVVCFFTIIISGYWVLRIMRTSGFTPALVYQIVRNKGELLTTFNGRTNILILGVGGDDHEGGDLTDTMIVMSIDVKRKKIALISLPRDIWSDMLKDKINTAYHYGEQKKNGGGLTLAKVTAEDITGLNIPYSLLLDFSGFTKFINLIDGIDLFVPVAFTDPQYPIPGKEHESCPGDPTNACVYQEIRFEEGLQHMDGERALMYVRSRHATGPEGSDFSRNRRQQEVLMALKNKIVRVSSWVTRQRIEQLIDLYNQSIDTDMKLGEIVSVFSAYMRTDESSFVKVSLDADFIQAPDYLYSGRYVLVPKESWVSVKNKLVDFLKK